MRGEGLRHHHVDRQHDLALERLRLGEDVARGLRQVVLAQRLADRLALRGKEGVGHAAADDQRIDVVKQVAEEIELGGNLRAADDGGDRALRRVQRLLQRRKLFLHGAAGISGQKMRDRLDRSVRAVRDRERIVDVNVAELRKSGRKRRIVLFFAFVEAGIFQAENVARLHARHRLFGGLADAVVGKGDRAIR